MLRLRGAGWSPRGEGRSGTMLRLVRRAPCRLRRRGSSMQWRWMPGGGRQPPHAPCTPPRREPPPPLPAWAAPAAAAAKVRRCRCGRQACMTMGALLRVNGAQTSPILCVQLPGGPLPATWSPLCLEQVGKGALACWLPQRLHHRFTRTCDKLLGMPPHTARAAHDALQWHQDPCAFMPLHVRSCRRCATGRHARPCHVCPCSPLLPTLFPAAPCVS